MVASPTSKKIRPALNLFGEIMPEDFFAQLLAIVTPLNWQVSSEKAILMIVEPEDRNARTVGREAGRRVVLESRPHYLHGLFLGLRVERLCVSSTPGDYGRWDTMYADRERMEWHSYEMTREHRGKLQHLYDLACMNAANHTASKAIGLLTV